MSKGNDQELGKQNQHTTDDAKYEIVTRVERKRESIENKTFI